MLRASLYLLFLGFTGLANAEVQNISNAELQALLAQGVPIIDVRRAEEWKQTGVVENSHLLTFFDQRGQYDLPVWLENLDKIAKKDQPLVLICRTGNRTSIIGQALDKKFGYSKVYSVTQGITGWKRDGLPVVPCSQC